MPIFQRRGNPILNADGLTEHRSIRFSNDARLEVFDGYGPIGPGRHTQFRLKFSNDENSGWLVNTRCLDELIVELLHIKADIMVTKEEQPENDPPF